MKEFALIFRLKDIADFKPTPEQMQERMNWLAGIASQNKLVDKGNTLLPSAESAKTVKPKQRGNGRSLYRNQRIYQRLHRGKNRYY